MELVNLKEMPKILAKYEKLISKVEKSTKEDSEKEGKTKNLYTVVLVKPYMVNDQVTDTVLATTLKEVRKIIRSNKLLSEFKKETSEKVEKPKKAKESKEAKEVKEEKDPKKSK